MRLPLRIRRPGLLPPEMPERYSMGRAADGHGRRAPVGRRVLGHGELRPHPGRVQVPLRLRRARVRPAGVPRKQRGRVLLWPRAVRYEEVGRGALGREKLNPTKRFLFPLGRRRHDRLPLRRWLRRLQLQQCLLPDWRRGHDDWAAKRNCSYRMSSRLWVVRNHVPRPHDGANPPRYGLRPPRGVPRGAALDPRRHRDVCVECVGCSLCTGLQGS
mmetsp:Transcript_1166/g.4354  ORF Transcript_1166/g.4354 Transcript_1166/m.4354 type:complete len:215 (-) Transcript_1166:1020-1664(-)